MKLKSLALGVAALLTVSVAHAHCGGAFCTLNTNWDVQGVLDKPGIRFDLRAEFIQPLYQRVRGVQLTTDWSAVGVSVQF